MAEKSNNPYTELTKKILYEARVDLMSKVLHEAGREAVEKNKMVNANTHKKFLEWKELEDHMKEGRRIQARYLLKYFEIFPLHKVFLLPV